MQTKVANTFEGHPCVKCNNTTRYVGRGMCVNCNRVRARKAHYARMDAKVPLTKDELSFKATVKKVYERSKSW